jgi:hypothetical protein
VSFELFRAVTPFFTLAVTIVVAVIAYLLKDKMGQLEKKVDELERDLKKVDRIQAEDQKEILKEFVDKETFHMAIGKQEGVIKSIFGQLNDLSATLNQTIGSLRKGGGQHG